MEDKNWEAEDDPGDQAHPEADDDDDLLEIVGSDEEIDLDTFADLLRPDLVSKAFKALSADAQRAGGELKRADVNRTYLRRGLSAAECVEVEERLRAAGHQIIEDADVEDPEVDGAQPRRRKRLRYLSQAEERELGRRIQMALALPKDVSRLDQTYVGRVRADADRAKAMFVAANMRYVYALARRRGHRKHLSLEDLVQEGVIGLLRATDLYDPERGFRFKTYATWWIEQRMRRAIADSDRIVRLPVHLHEKLSRIKRAEAKLTLAHGRAPEPDELATSMGMDPERLMKLLWRVQATDCIEGDSPVGEDTTFLALTPDRAPSPFELASHRELQERFSEVLSTLTAREERVLRLRFGVGLDRPHTLESVGRQYSVTRERIRQIEAKALRKLQHFVRSRRLRGFLDD